MRETSVNSVFPKWRAEALGLCVAALLPGAAGAESAWKPGYTEFYGSAELEGTFFFEEPAFDGQERHGASVALEPSFLAEWADGDVAFTVTPFLRLDAVDEERTHADFRELKVDLTEGDWSATIGADTVFWGKTEAVHLVDIINQDDAVEDVDGEDKLGQPMIKLAMLTDYGEFSGFYLPYFRERTFAGEDGRLRSGILVDADAARYETSQEEWTPGFAARWTKATGGFDLGASAFHGLSRDPAFDFELREDGPRLIPVYSRITQAGFDGQYTTGPALWKAEAIGRAGQRDRDFEKNDYLAATGGLEYTFFQIAETDMDLGLLGEYAWDSRGDAATTPFQNDAVAGARLTFNDVEDTAILFFGTVDMETGGTILRLEAERRIWGGWRLEVEGSAFLGVDADDVAADLADDSFLRGKLTYFW